MFKPDAVGQALPQFCCENSSARRVWSDMYHFLPCLKSVTLIQITSLLLIQTTWSMLVQVNRKRTHQTCRNRFSHRFCLQWVFSLTRHNQNWWCVHVRWIHRHSKLRQNLFIWELVWELLSVPQCTCHNRDAVEMCRFRLLYKHPSSQVSVQKNAFVYISLCARVNAT